MLKQSLISLPPSPYKFLAFTSQIYCHYIMLFCYNFRNLSFIEVLWQPFTRTNRSPQSPSLIVKMVNFQMHNERATILDKPHETLCFGGNFDFQILPPPIAMLEADGNVLDESISTRSSIYQCYRGGL